MKPHSTGIKQWTVLLFTMGTGQIPYNVRQQCNQGNCHSGWQNDYDWGDIILLKGCIDTTRNEQFYTVRCSYTTRKTKRISKRITNQDPE